MPRGHVADPEAVLKWLECFRIYMYSNFESRVKEIIGIDGTLFPYPELEPPPLPEFVAGPVEMEMWKSALKKHNKAVTVHESDCFKLY